MLLVLYYNMTIFLYTAYNVGDNLCSLLKYTIISTILFYFYSLNKTRRQRDLLRVTHENQAILKRIQSKEPHYNHLQWLDQWHINRGYMSIISKYPHSWMTKEKVGFPCCINYSVCTLSTTGQE